MESGSKFMGYASAANGDVINQNDIKLCTGVSKNMQQQGIYLLPKMPQSGNIIQAIDLR